MKKMDAQTGERKVLLSNETKVNVSFSLKRKILLILHNPE